MIDRKFDEIYNIACKFDNPGVPEAQIFWKVNGETLSANNTTNILFRTKKNKKENIIICELKNIFTSLKKINIQSSTTLYLQGKKIFKK